MSDTKDGRRKTEDGSDGRVDLAIDRAVREMLDVEPPAGLRGRVVERIERPRRLASRWTWALVPAMAVIVLVLVFPSRRPAVAPIPTLTVATTPRLPDAPVSRVLGQQRLADAPEVATAGPHAETVRAASGSRGVSRIVRAETTALASETAVETLASIDPIGVKAIGPAGIPHADVFISPLASIPEIRVERLSPPDGRN